MYETDIIRSINLYTNSVKKIKILEQEISFKRDQKFYKNLKPKSKLTFLLHFFIDISNFHVFSYRFASLVFSISSLWCLYHSSNSRFAAARHSSFFFSSAASTQ